MGDQLSAFRSQFHIPHSKLQLEIATPHLDKTRCFHYKSQQFTVALALEEQFAAPLMRSASGTFSPH
jgi:hypothetical protein